MVMQYLELSFFRFYLISSIFFTFLLLFVCVRACVLSLFVFIIDSRFLTSYSNDCRFYDTVLILQSCFLDTSPATPSPIGPSTATNECGKIPHRTSHPLWLISGT